MAGPIDTRVNPTKVNELAKSRPIEWFDRHLISAVPWRHPGAFRHVYPGFVQLSAFMSMNLDRHINAHFGQFRSLVGGDHISAEAHRRFYDEYGAVMDLPAEFYLETVQRVFQEHDLPRGALTWHGQPVRPGGDPPHGPADSGRRARRYLRDRPDDGDVGSVQPNSGQPQAKPSADWRRPLRGVQRQTLGERGLSAGTRDDPGDELTRLRCAQSQRKCCSALLHHRILAQLPCQGASAHIGQCRFFDEIVCVPARSRSRKSPSYSGLGHLTFGGTSPRSS